MSGIATKTDRGGGDPDQIQQGNLSIEVTTRCTNDCRHCFARAGREHLPELSLVDAQSAVDEAYELGYRHLHITGGEPLLWHHLFDLLDYAADKGYETCLINTNGSLLNGEIAKCLATSRLKVSLSISLHGPEELHDELSGPGSFQAALRGIRVALAAGVRVTVFTVARRTLLDRLPHFAQFLFTELAGIDELTIIQLIRVPEDAIDLALEMLTPEDFLKLVRFVALLNLYGYRISVLENPLAKVAADRMGLPWIAPAPPLYRAGKIVLMADGSLTLAHSSRETLGTYKPGMLGAILSSDGYNQRLAHDTTICPQCEFQGFCTKRGLIRPSEWFRDTGETLPFCKRVLNLTRSA